MPEALQMLLNELESTRLEVCLAPLRSDRRGYSESGMKRVALSRNCNWYRAFTARHLSSRVRQHKKPDTKIKRRNVVRLLERLCAGRPSRSKYVDEILGLARRAGK